MTEEQAHGTWDQAKGKVKEDVGRAAGDSSTQLSGKVDQAKGKAEEAIGNVKQDIHREIDSH